MLSCMDTPNGLVVMGPGGKRLRLPSNHPAYRAGRDIMRQALPAEQAWHKLQELVSNPLKAVVDWFERYGLVFTGHGDTVHVNDRAFNRDAWLPLFQRSLGVGANPRHVLQFAEKLGDMAETAQVGQVALHLRDDKLRGMQPAVLRMVGLPAEARPGDLVNPSSTGPVPFLVSFDDYSVDSTGQLVVARGIVLSKVVNTDEAADTLAQPAILGYNMTYRCEEGSVSGWLEDLSFDSLKAAQRNAKEIQNSGGEARIINRITGVVVPLD